MRRTRTTPNYQSPPPPPSLMGASFKFNSTEGQFRYNESDFNRYAGIPVLSHQPEYFRLTMSRINPQHVFYMATSPLKHNITDGERSVVSDIDDISESLPRAASMNSETTHDYQSTDDLPSPPSSFRLDELPGAAEVTWNVTEHSPASEGDLEDSNEVTMVDDYDEPALFQPSGHIEINKVLEDIPEEEEEESSTATKSLQMSQKSMQLQHDLSLNSSSSLSSSNSDTRKEARGEITLKDFDDLLQDLQASENDKSLSLSRPSSPDVPLQSPLSISLMPRAESTPTSKGATDFVKAMNRLSQTSLDHYVYEPDLPASNPPGKLLSPRHSFLNIEGRHIFAQPILNKKETEDFAELLTERLKESQWQQNGEHLSRQDSSESQLRRQASLSGYLLPPEEFSEDSGLPASDTDEDKRQGKAVAGKYSQLVHSARASRSKILVSPHFI